MKKILVGLIVLFGGLISEANAQFFVLYADNNQCWIDHIEQPEPIGDKDSFRYEYHIVTTDDPVLVTGYLELVPGIFIQKFQNYIPEWSDECIQGLLTEGHIGGPFRLHIVG